MRCLWPLLLLTGCPVTSPTDETEQPADCFVQAPSVEIGTGEIAFEALPEPPTVVMVHGPQGGWHVLGSARISHTSQFVRIRFEVVDVRTDVEVASNQYTVALVMDQECSGYFPGMYAFLDVSELASGDLDTPPELLAERELRLVMTIEDDAGRAAGAEQLVVAKADAAESPDG